MFIQVKTTPVGSEAVKFYLSDDANEPFFVGKPMVFQKAATFIGAVTGMVLIKKGVYNMDYGTIKIQKAINARTIVVTDADVYKWITDKNVPDEVFKMVRNDLYTAASLKKALMQLKEFKHTPNIKLL